MGSRRPFRKPSRRKLSRRIERREPRQRFLIICEDGTFRIIGPEAKVLIPGKILYMEVFDQEKGARFTVLYRDKTKIEDVFKNVKSFLKIRPFFVNTQAHVKAVYTICILAYFLNKFLAKQRKTGGEKDYLNSKELYAPFSNIDFVTLFDKISGTSITKSVELPEKTKNVLEKIGMTHVFSSQ